ncbi:hypothetical protein A3K48_05440 [candidate division WOR-1 bacterium RIFOXYA12_FULL_52_29]|uniref:Uncharacterized protein n=1 Tax=candidate division WOR-1 bacterium RIFOXYC12_FULL_54_18 TaxID=1802584 RepID=A0A1F4T6N3_UNCSA|nr:MAG: hypothetical protein A3K44_05440 [candidate division WOR-1 bacterium RIFOXYA2_FULL_51_19]OGC17985.1 MAG: hypothetical protein A3K48_05440 [candidate division WOR-1 bacterium RIFOXYA12_FULL_52_29]OGC26841.1 MAG: hypothetical protein A3K32_05435 [candidate division WOR-1 bacterium RIFOXYB2_FULL_45_9]OGC28402.1 MAG: hypothetical protein A3K49_05440 [candidate division WOR-1 bacterium RIFOXYC12_FULL_54_18]OGC31143.1 MAG: hypothetical protein A2346_07180 [candidate division WOR-1 bacterium R
MKKALVILFLLAILPTLAPAISPGVKLGEISSLMLSPSETDVEISFAIPMTPINVIEMGTDQEFEIFWKLKDDSRTAGFPLRATANLMAYDFASWKATPAGEEKVIVGDDSPWNKYEEAGAWKIKPELAKPVVRYTCLLAGATRQKERAEAVSFYAAKILPEGITRSQQAKGSAARWIASRLERAIVLRTLGTVWQGSVKNEPQDLKKAAAQTEESLKMIFGFGTPQEYAAGNGCPFLEVAGLDFLSTPLLIPGGVVYEAYSWGMWAEKTVKGTVAVWPEVFSRERQLINASDNGFGQALLSAAESCRDEADEAMNIMYVQPGDPGNKWQEKLLAERSQLKSLSEKAAVVISKILLAAESGGIPENDKLAITAFIDSIGKIASSEATVLEKALAGN